MTAERQHGDRRICIGLITGPRGLRGEVWVNSFASDATELGAYGPLSDEYGGQWFDVRVVSAVKGRIVAAIAGINDRNAAEALIGTRLYALRKALPDVGEDEYYHADLIGLAVYENGSDRHDEALGRVLAVQDYGAGPLLDIDGGYVGPVMIPFTRAQVPVIDLPRSRIEVVLLPGTLHDRSDDRR